MRRRSRCRLAGGCDTRDRGRRAGDSNIRFARNQLRRLGRLSASRSDRRAMRVVGRGKSTLLNRLAGEALMATNAMRDDGRGKHTTSVRQLVVLPNGAALVDTPGMRSFTPWAQGADVDRAFGEISDLALGCRFADCKHVAEPGCAVREGASSERLEQWQKLQREMAWIESRDDPFAAQQRKRAWKQIHKAARAQRRST